MKRNNSTRKQGHQKGLAVVEFAIILPVIVLIALAVTELGRGLYQYNTLTKAVRDGARYLSGVVTVGSGGLDTDTYRTVTENLVVYGNVTGTGTPVLPGFGTGNVSLGTVAVPLLGGGITVNHVQVSATFTFVPLFPALSALGYSMVPTMTASTIQRALIL